MGASIGTQKPSKRRRLSPMAEINVTPMVDVMLVLLVIFMISAPLMTAGVPVDLPSSAAPVLQEKTEPLILSLDKEGRLFIQETETSLDVLAPRLTAITGANPEARIYIRADRALPYGQVMEVMGLVSQAGYPKVALVSEPATLSSPRKLKGVQRKF